MNNKHLYKISALLILTAMLATFTHCVSEEKASTSSSTRSPSSNPTTTGSSGATGVAAIQVTTGVKNHEQIFQTMSALTGVPTSNAGVLNVYNEVAPTLPTSNDVKAFLAPNNVAVVKLAAEYCNQLLENQALRDALFNTSYNNLAMINFSTVTLANLSVPATKASFIQRLTDNFWGGIISEEDLNESEADLNDLFNYLQNGDSMANPVVPAEANNNAGAKKVAKGVCTAVLSSAHVTLL